MAPKPIVAPNLPRGARIAAASTGSDTLACTSPSSFAARRSPIAICRLLVAVAGQR
ncbi:MAG: hypothetical protein R2726_03195 [Acidimicrobiales bacterium]